MYYEWYTQGVYPDCCGYVLDSCEHGAGLFFNPYVVDFVEEKTPIYDTIEEKCSESIAAGLEGELGSRIRQRSLKSCRFRRA